MTKGAKGFDFLHGQWRVTHRKLTARLSGARDWFDFPGALRVDPVLNGLGNIDINDLDDPGGAYCAHSLRLFDAPTNSWSIWWIDRRSPAIDPPVVGGFTGRKGVFFGDDLFAGKPIRVRTTYEPIDEAHAEWTQAFSADGGTSWEVNWIMAFHRS
ncbi:MAG: DUF1579 domain-containing protein [Pseudomonadota bacterium]